jgi:hypothetical protein
MKKFLSVALLLCLFFLLPTLSSAKGIDLYSLFPNLTLGFDPGIQDTVYIDSTCELTATTLTVDVRVKTDAAPGDSIQGIFVPLVINADQPGVTLDTTIASTYTGTALQSWDDSVDLYVSVTSGGGDPSVFPLNVIVGGVNVNWNPSTVLGDGDHLIAKLKFNVSTPTNICVVDTFNWYGSLMLVTTQANGYTPAFMGGCCGPAVPTLSEWGLILFGVVLFGTVVWYLRRRRHAATG